MKTDSENIEILQEINIIFDERSPYWELTDEYNALFLRSTIENFNRKFKICNGVIPFYVVYSSIVGRDVITVDKYNQIKDYYFDKTSFIKLDITTDKDDITHFTVKTTPKDIRRAYQK